TGLPAALASGELADWPLAAATLAGGLAKLDSALVSLRSALGSPEERIPVTPVPPGRLPRRPPR
ncbi:MAG TPA: hypothetical protein VGD91_05560, partial [Trebonia sp.]